jgi:hypothetical protein
MIHGTKVDDLETDVLAPIVHLVRREKVAGNSVYHGQGHAALPQAQTSCSQL